EPDLHLAGDIHRWIGQQIANSRAFIRGLPNVYWRIGNTEQLGNDTHKLVEKNGLSGPLKECGHQLLQVHLMDILVAGKRRQEHIKIVGSAWIVSVRRWLHGKPA